jgi:phosphoglycolate phosphatase
MYLFTDLDNTIYNWVDYFAPSFRAMVHVLSRELRVAEEELLLQFKDVYGKQGSLEYAFAVQELTVCRGLAKEEVERLVRLAKGAFSRVREKNLVPYQEVEGTLDWLTRSGVQVIGVTNAPVFQAKGRLKQLKLDHYFHGLAAWEGHHIPTDDLEITKDIQMRATAGGYTSAISEQRIWPLREEELKPSSTGYKRIISDLSILPGEVYIVGDSLGKDLAPAIEIEAVAVWARYGKVFQEKNMTTLLAITHWNQTRIHSTYSEDSIVPAYTIDSFGDLRGIVPTPQLALF